MMKGTLAQDIDIIDRGKGRRTRRLAELIAVSRMLDRKGVLSYALHLVILCALIAITWIYVSSESGIYWWDYANYQNITHGTLSAFCQSPRDAFLFIQRSLANNYNAVFTIPLLPFLLTFGESRLTFEIAMVTVYSFPFTLIMGHIAKRIFPEQSRFAYWSAIILTLLTPSAWAPVLRGYPDIGAAFFSALALLLSIDTSSKRMQSMALAGVGLAIASLLRRHFVYSVLSFFLSRLLFLGWYFVPELSRNVKRAITAFLRDILGLGVAGSTLLVTLFLIGRPFLRLVVTQNFNVLYASYEQPWYAVLSRFAFSFGWIFWILGIAGCIIGIISGDFGLQLVCTFGITSAVVWISLGRQSGNHYSLHFILLIVQGMVVLSQTIRKSRHSWWHYIVYITGLFLLFINFIFGLTPVGSFDSRWRKLFAQNWPPIQRQDVDQLIQLMEDLRFLTADRQESVVYVVASSPTFNSDLIANLERRAYGWEAARLNLVSYEVDSKHPYPLEALLRAQIVVMAKPLQLHLDPKEQGLVRSVFDLFTEGLHLAEDFALLPNHYVLGSEVTVYLFRRVKPTAPDVAIQTLEFIKKYVSRRSVVQSPWIVLNPPRGASVYAYSPYQYRIILPTRTENSFPLSLLFLEQQTQVLSVNGRINYLSRDCPTFRFTLFKMHSDDEEGEKHPVCTLSSNSDDNHGEFVCSLQGVPGDGIVFYVQEADTPKNDCLLEMWIQMTTQSKGSE